MSAQPVPAVTPAQAAARAAGEHGVFLYQETAEHIAAAVLAAHDGTFGVREAVAREMWQNSDLRTHLRRSMWHRLLAELADRSMVPAALPTESLRYLTDRYSVTGEVTVSMEMPAELAESGTAAWEVVAVTLEVPVRQAPAAG
ncbi:hypothetical protein ACQP10_38430 (plasmid) [Streptosporangium sandarakinum]|uniref:hypothetical protein n=1 Tax=Streptosporangium sandarakinum TaxID=1260955 RepID=UPI003D8B5947